MDLNITPRRFFLTGIFCFTIIALANSVGFAMNIRGHNLFSAIASIGYIFFGFVTAGFFYYLYKSDPSAPLEIEEGVAGDSIDDILKELDLKGGFKKNDNKKKIFKRRV